MFELTYLIPVSKNGFVIKLILILKGLLLLFLINGCNDKEVRSKYITAGSNPVIIDGTLKEWDDEIFISFEDKIKIAAYNDDEFYYLGGQVLDKSIGKIFALSGIAIIINPDGDKKKNIEMSFTYPGRREIDYRKGGFFQTLTGDQKIKTIRNLGHINNAVFVIDTSELKSLVFADSSKSSFQAKMMIAEDKLFFEIKIPIYVNKYFESYNALNEKSLFCLKPAGNSLRGQIFGTPISTMNTSTESKGNTKRKQEGFNKNDKSDFQYWFSLKTSYDE